MVQGAHFRLADGSALGMVTEWQHCTVCFQVAKEADPEILTAHTQATRRLTERPVITAQCAHMSNTTLYASTCTMETSLITQHSWGNPLSVIRDFRGPGHRTELK